MLSGLGTFVTPGTPGSFSASSIVTCAPSAKTVGVGTLFTFTTVMTSESSVLFSTDGVAPGAAVSDLMRTTVSDGPWWTLPQPLMSSGSTNINATAMDVFFTAFT